MFCSDRSRTPIYRILHSTFSKDCSVCNFSEKPHFKPANHEKSQALIARYGICVYESCKYLKKVPRLDELAQMDRSASFLL